MEIKRLSAKFKVNSSYHHKQPITIIIIRQK